MPFLASEGCFWPLTASITLEVKNNHAHVTTQRILNSFIEVNFSVGCIVWPRCCLFQPLPRLLLIRCWISLLLLCISDSFWLQWDLKQKLYLNWIAFYVLTYDCVDKLADFWSWLPFGQQLKRYPCSYECRVVLRSIGKQPVVLSINKEL